ncbi:O-acyltransferase, WSD1-like, N-terminal [Dillenia turbinata]|uniref:O-acyltransferase, WSD1-like, N-terminal n=1 Tax=Dillenia turbinata TaxID=194707 RepID=A0AAN8WGH8_9MAGN
MGSAIAGTDEPLSPIGRLFLREDFYEFANLLVGLEKPIDLEASRLEIENSLLIKHPRFGSLLLRDKNGKEYWRKTQVDLDRHFIVLADRVGEGDDEEEIVNQYMADLAVSSPLSTNKPLWECHFLLAHKCVAMRFHHALGDGISLASLLSAVFRKLNDQSPTTVMPSTSSLSKKSQDKSKAWMFVMVVVKKSVTDATINDVFFAILSSGLSRYLHHRSISVQDGLQLTGIGMVNLRQEPGLQEISNMMKSFSRSRWGNHIGVHLLPLYYPMGVASPLDYLRRAMDILTKKKLSIEAIARHLCYKLICNTTFGISNVVGFQDKMSFAGNPIKYMRTNTSALPQVDACRQIQVHMTSYAGRADMQILVAKDIIPDPKFLAKCFEDSLLEMKDAAIKLQS